MVQSPPCRARARNQAAKFDRPPRRHTRTQIGKNIARPTITNPKVSPIRPIRAGRSRIRLANQWAKSSTRSPSQFEGHGQTMPSPPQGG